jgi:hypothetical protein
MLAHPWRFVNTGAFSSWALLPVWVALFFAVLDGGSRQLDRGDATKTFGKHSALSVNNLRVHTETQTPDLQPNSWQGV